MGAALPPGLGGPGALTLAEGREVVGYLLFVPGRWWWRVLEPEGALGVELAVGRRLGPGGETAQTMYRPCPRSSLVAPLDLTREPDRLILQGVRTGHGGMRKRHPGVSRQGGWGSH